jgi:type III pantothenate kinase
MLDRMLAELGEDATVVATGGLAPVVMPYCRHPLEHDPWLTLQGLRLVFERNVGNGDA